MLEKIEKFQILLVGIIIVLGGIIATGMVTSRISKDVISVTGSYSQDVTSDKGKLEFTINAKEINRAKAYTKISQQIPTVKKYLLEQGFKQEDIDIEPVSGYEMYRVTPNGSTTNQVEAYNSSQRIVVKSDDVDKIKEISTDITSLADKGVEISNTYTSYYYSKLSDLKVQMLEKASLNAKQRAKAMLKATHNKVGKIQSVQMGVFQITPADSTEVSDYGISDTSSIKKKVTSVTNVTFRVK